MTWICGLLIISVEVWWLDDLLGLCCRSNDAELGHVKLGGFARWWCCILGDVVFLLQQVLEAVHGAGLRRSKWYGEIETVGRHARGTWRGSRNADDREVKVVVLEALCSIQGKHSVDDLPYM